MLEAEGTSRRLLSTRHGHLPLRINGEGDPPLVLLHMGLASGRMFRHITPRLSAGRRVVVPDRLGFGSSDHPRPGLTLGDYADATLEALDAAGIGQFDVAGVHTGSCESIDLAARYPDRVRRIAVVTGPAARVRHGSSWGPARSLDRVSRGVRPPDLRLVTVAQAEHAAHIINHQRRRSLNHQSPAELYAALTVH